MTALSLCNETLGFRMNSFAAPEPRFWGNSVIVTLAGRICIELDKHGGEMYEISRPSIQMSGFLAGSHRLEFVGVANMTCATLGLAAEIDFKARSVLGRSELNAVAGRIYDIASGNNLYMLSGTWDSVIYVTESATGKETVLFDYTHIHEEYSMCPILPPVSEREETFSSKVWAECSEAIWNSDSAGANAAKRKVEDAQRLIRKARADSGKEHEHRFFQPRTDGLEGYMLRESIRSQLGPEVVISDEDMQVVQKTQRFLAPSTSSDNNIAIPVNGKKKLLGLGRSRKN
jgi:oxysterol-binding protein-related protein 8